MVDRPKSAMQARRSLLTSMFAFVDDWGVSMEVFHLEETRHTPFRSPCTMRRSCMYFKPFATPANWTVYQECRCEINWQRTSSVRFICRSCSMNALMFPCSIHSETRANRCSFNVTPSNGKMLGCRRCLHATPSRQNLCNPFIQVNIIV